MTTDVIVQVEEPTTDAEQLERLSGTLREELLGLDVDTVTRLPAGSPPPPGTRSVDLTAAGGLLVSLNATIELLTSVVLAIRGWLKRSPRPDRTVELTIDDATIRITAASSDQQDRLIEDFIRSHDRGRGT